METYQKRKDVPKKYQFDLSDFYQNMEEFSKSLKKMQQEVEKLSIYEKKELDANTLEEYLKILFPIRDEIESLYAYAYLSHDVDLENQTYIEALDQVLSCNTRFETVNCFFESTIIAKSRNEFEALFLQNPNLLPYEKFLRKIYKEKEHHLTKEEEKIISILTENFNSFHRLSSMLINQEHDYGSVLVENKKWKIAPNNLLYLKQQKEQKIRKTVQKKFGSTLEQYQNTESAYLNYYIKNRTNLSKIRHYPSTWEEMREGIELPNKLFQNLVESAKEHKDAYQNYYRLMKKVLDQKTLHSYDTLQNWGKKTKEYSVEDAQDIITKALAPLQDNYLSKLKRVFEEHHIDYYSYEGKVNGGYNLSTSLHPSRIVMSFCGTFQDVLTIAHESGHNVHHQYIQQKTPTWYQDISMYTAEIASLTNEFLVNDYLKHHGKTKEEKMLGMEHTIKTFQNNFFGAIMEGEMEEKMYKHIEQGNTITADFLNNLAKKQLKFYQGDVIKHDKYSPLMWVTRSHFFLDFYLYSYAICVSIAASLAKRIINLEPGIIEKYEDFLSSGSNITVEEAYQKLGIDIQSKYVFNNAIAFFQEQIDDYEKLLNKEGEVNE